MDIYLAGKISASDWRHQVVPGLRDKDWGMTTSLPLEYGHRYFGPFFIACDHRCNHGPNTHGANADGSGLCNDQIDDIQERQQQVVAKSFAGIRAAHFVIVYAESNFETAYGTMVEIGYAAALDKPIILIVHPTVNLVDQWFLRQSVVLEIVSANPAATTLELLRHGVGIPFESQKAYH